mgnify:CR=1 FL=1
MSKKIGLITFHRTTNFGSLLQTFALYRKIEDLGHVCEVIDYRCPAIEKRENLSKKTIDKNLKTTIRNILFLPGYKDKARKMNKFIYSNMNVSDEYGLDSIKNSNEQYDKFMVGSDIVWGRDITEDDYTYFLEFVEDSRKKYAFASSVGDYSFRGDEDRVSSLLNEFNRIAVRENDAIEWINKIGGPRSEWVCDPTMLLTADEWKKYIMPKYYPDEYVLVYFRDPKGKCSADAIKYAKKNHCKVLFINYDFPVKGMKNVKPKTLEEFLGLILNAKMIFTASYHGMLFSTYFNKEFLFYTRAHKSRVLSLAERLELNQNCGDEIDVDRYESIDYIVVNHHLQKFREASIKVLAEMLNE